MIARLWQENRRFILISAAGLVVFLIADRLIESYLIERIDRLTRKSSELAQNCRKLLREIKPLAVERRRLEELTAHETQLRSELELPRESELEKLDKASPLVQFNGAVDRAWGQATEKANQAGVAVPEKLGPRDFKIEKADDESLYARHYAYLGVARRALHALIEAGMTELGRPRIGEDEALEVIKDDESVLCLLRSVRMTVAGPYESYVKCLKALQAPGSFLQVTIEKLAQKPGDDRTVKGELMFTALSLVEGEPPPASPAPAGKAPVKEAAPRRRK